ncbi:kinase-like protein [Zopfochytrium polystomum]|nr:kinase-like protein [Zopfochytrium polystomum]
MTASVSSTSSRKIAVASQLRSQKQVPTYDDKEGHYIVVENEDLTPRYKILRLLGQGTFGKVVEAYDRTRKERVAIKIIRAVQKYRDASRVEIRVLQTLKERDPMNTKRCIHLVSHFDFRNHVCMVFELLAQSIFDYLKDNHFQPFPTWQIQEFAHQIVEAVQFLHGLGLIHTDLKPENLMLQNTNSVVVDVKDNRPRKELIDTRIKLIDFGSAIFETDYHSSVVSTRHYRAPEIIMGLGWSSPCDMWSIGCILVELFTGDALFQTHDNEKGHAKGFFKDNGQLQWPNPEASKSSRKYVKSLQPLASLIRPHDQLTADFLDLVKRLLTYEPNKRMTASQALAHPFFVRR